MSNFYKNLNTGKLTDNIKQERMGAVTAQVDIDGDLPEKQTHNNNSWFAFGRYEVEGHTINLLFHLMGMKVPVKGMTYQSVVTVYDETTGYYFAKDHLYSKSKCEVHGEDFFVKVPNGSMQGKTDKMFIHIDEDEIKADFELSAIHYPILIGGTSVFEMCNMCIHEYSVPRMLTKGTLTVEGHTYDLTDKGYGWFDRQWQNIDYVHSTMKWTWMAISLDSGDIISVFDTDLEGFEDNLLAAIDSEGNQINLRPIPRFADGEKEYWLTETSKRKYPVRWELQFPQVDSVLEIVPTKKEQEIKSVLSELNKYEGNCTVKGTYKDKPVTGHALVEMIGHWYR